MLNIFNQALSDGILPADLRMAVIVVILKPDKVPMSCESYRPISLLNFEVKVLAKLLATRLAGVIETLIHMDQWGFMPHRSTRLNLRRLFGILHVTQTESEEQAALLSLDASLAFDSMEWSHLYAVLGHCGLGPKFIAWIKLLYNQPMARVCVNAMVSRAFNLHRGTRQGCPLSPILYALALEPLATWVRQDPLIWGIPIGEEWEDRISLYADDILLFVRRPRQSVDRILQIFCIFGEHSGYRINWNKSVLFPLAGGPPALTSRCSVPVTESGFKYLGIYITRDLGEFYKQNLGKQLDRLIADTIHWRTLPLTPMGRAALFKMMALPHLLYMLQNTPHEVSLEFFRRVESELRTLLWSGADPVLLCSNSRKGFMMGDWQCRISGATIGQRNW